jgi:DNA modification methylase
VLDDFFDEQKALAYVVADNELARQSDPDQAQLAAILEELQAKEPLPSEAFGTSLVEAAGYSAQELEQLLRLVNPKPPVDAEPAIDRASELQKQWQTEAGQIWRIGPHTLICADCRQPETWQRLLAGSKVNGVFTSPPYAEQRKEQYGGVPTDEYVDWWEAVQDNVRANLADDGSFFVNIKAHCEDGQRVLYVCDLVLAMVRRWGWLYVDDLVWVKNGFPGGWNNRFKDKHEPIYHFSPMSNIKFRPEAVSVESDDVFDYTPQNTANKAGSNKQILAGVDEFRIGMARPSNVLQIASNREAIGQAAMFPVALPDFFVRAYSDPGDIWLDPFVGSGTTMVAAHQNGRIGLGIERLPSYCAVILERFAAIGVMPELVESALVAA